MSGTDTAGEPLGPDGARFDAALASGLSGPTRMVPAATVHALLEAAPDAVVVHNVSGGILLVNHQTEVMFGISRTELFDRTVEALIPERFHRSHITHRDEYTRMPRTRQMGSGLRLWGRRGDGTEFPVEVSLSPLQTDDGLLIISTIRDVTARQRAEDVQRLLADVGAVLGASLDQRDLLNGIARVLVPVLADWCIAACFDEDGLLNYAGVAHVQDEVLADIRALLHAYRNVPAAADAFLRSALEHGRVLQFPEFHPEQASVDDSVWRQIFDKLAPGRLMVVPCVARAHSAGVLICARGSNGEAYSADEIALAEDVGRRAALAVENARLYQQSQQALTIRDQFLSAITHDLGQPLTVIHMAAQVLRRKLAATGNKAAGRDELTGIESAAVNLQAMVTELTDLARTQQGRPLDLVYRTVDLVELVRREVEAEQQTTNRHPLVLETTQPMIEGEWDPMRLSRVIANLLNNAIKYSPAGGTITVRLHTFQEQGYPWVELVVVDPGIGIPAGDLARIGEPFYRGSNVAGRIRGTGIGLSGSRQIVAQHGGTLTIESVEGGGTSVTVRLPVK